MPVVINGSTGISGTDGSASTPAIQGTDTNTGIFFPAADTIAFSEGGVESMRVDSSGNMSVVGSLTAVNVTATGTITAGGVSVAPVINTQIFNSSGTWTKPSGYSATSRVQIEVWGAGASGARRASGNRTGGGGGGYNTRWLSLSQMGATETVTIGAGGAARTSTDQNGATGGDSSVGSLITAYGGGGGIQVASGSTTGGGGGGQLSAGTVGTTAVSNVSSNNAGRPFFSTGDGDASNGFLRQGDGSGGASSDVLSAFWHGGGGGAEGLVGCSSTFGGGGGGGGTSFAGGTSSFGGNGGASGTTTGTSGTQPGGGGGSASGTSGAGGAGRVIITVFPA